MTMQKCHECEKDVSSEAKNCPNCGAPVKKLISIPVKNQSQHI
jgi:rRNA maturation endonuclease Nob1